jgi:hypothetical protein
MNTQVHSISELDRKIAEAEFRIIALRDKAFKKSVIFARAAETLQACAEFVSGDTNACDPRFSSRSISMKVPLDLVEETINLTENLRSALRQREQLESLRRGLVLLHRKHQQNRAPDRIHRTVSQR